MTSIPPVKSAALVILQQPVSFGPPADARATPLGLVAAVNGLSAEQISGATPKGQQSQAKLSEAMFSVHTPNINQIKLDLYKRVGEKLGVNQNDYESTTDYWRALKSAYTKVEKQDDGAKIIMGIEKDLGLDKLGVSLKTVIDALVDPEANKKLTKALEEQVKKEATPKQTASGDPNNPVALLAQLDELGAYSA